MLELVGLWLRPQFLTKQGVQISAIWSMVIRVPGQLN
jgi:hypothetical protein